MASRTKQSCRWMESVVRADCEKLARKSLSRLRFLAVYRSPRDTPPRIAFRSLLFRRCRKKVRFALYERPQQNTARPISLPIRNLELIPFDSRGSMCPIYPARGCCYHGSAAVSLWRIVMQSSRVSVQRMTPTCARTAGISNLNVTCRSERSRSRTVRNYNALLQGNRPTVQYPRRTRFKEQLYIFQ